MQNSSPGHPSYLFSLLVHNFKFLPQSAFQRQREKVVKGKSRMKNRGGGEEVVGDVDNENKMTI